METLWTVWTLAKTTSKMGDTGPEPAMFWNQASPQVEALGRQPATEPVTYSLSCLQTLLGLGPSIIVTKETPERLHPFFF